ncbi:hypothetical protein JCM19274_1796 [Algibacter lectus]|uniref:Uncharacterized protein n=1 Tax=Algibacter lectus TaxID=221126 RepID=A0A090X768_9FLAO|nr:hypothetical protein JCM19274_1796 [Algibacter lectus]
MLKYFSPKKLYHQRWLYPEGETAQFHFLKFPMEKIKRTIEPTKYP